MMIARTTQLFASYGVLLAALACSEQRVTVHQVTQNNDAGDAAVTTADVTEDVRESPPCPSDMLLVNGDFCPVVAQTCKRWVTNDGKTLPPPESGIGGRCAEWARPVKCLSKTLEKKRFCVDRYEFPNIDGLVPQSWMSWHDVKRECENLGKRMCTKSEWTFACEGRQMQPYPYGEGYVRDKTACNFDHPIPNLNAFEAKSRDDKIGARLEAYLVKSGEMTRCVSPFGMRDSVGNLDEWVVNETGVPFKSALVGGHIFGFRNACRPMTDAHDETFHWYETGGRCCLSVNDD